MRRFRNVLRALAAIGAISLLASAADAADAKRKVVSLNPSLTAILLAIGAGDALVGVDDFSAKQQPEVASLPRVGGLFNPSLEAVVALEPDLVVYVPSAEQRDFRSRLESLGIPLAEFPNIRFAEVIENIDRLGRLVGREKEARARIDAIERTRDAVRSAVAPLPRTRTVVVLQRSPIYVVGRGSFIDEMLEVVGAENVARAFDDPYPRVGEEWMVAAAPEVLLDMGPDPAAAKDFWSRWSAIPAVRDDRVRTLEAERVTLPGPYLDESLVLLATTLHGESIRGRIDAERARVSVP